MGIIKREAFRATLISYAGLVLGYLNRFVLFILFLTTEQIGLLGLVLAVGLIFAQFSNLGMAYAVWRFQPFFINPEKRNYGFFQLAIYVNLVGVVLFSLIFYLLKEPICAYYVEKSALFIDYYYWTLPIGITVSFFLTMDNYLRNLHKNVISVVASELVVRIVTTVLICLFVWKQITFDQLLIIQSISYFLPLALLLAQLSRNRQVFWSVKDITVPNRFKRIIFSFSVYSYFNFIGVLLVVQLDTIMVASMLGLSEAGVFSIVINAVSGLQVPYRSLIRISSPFVSKYWKQRDMKAMQLLYARVSSIALVLGLLLFLMFWVNRNDIFGLLPMEYMDASPVFLLLAIGRLVDMYCGLNGSILITSKKFKSDLWFTGFLLTMVIILNLLLIPRFGIMGAAISTASAYVLYNIFRTLYLYKTYGLHPFKWNHLWILIGFIVVFAIADNAFEWVNGQLLRIFLKTSVTGIGSLCMLYYLRLDTDVRQYLENAVGKVREMRRRPTSK